MDSFFIIPVLFMVAFLSLFVWSIVWVYNDAEKRGKSGCLVALLVLFLSWPIGLLAWLIFRPEEPEEKNYRF